MLTSGVKNRKKLVRAIKKQTKLNENWKNSNDILSLIGSLEREIMLTASLLPSETYSQINNELKLQHDQIRQEILEQQRIAREASLKKQRQKAAQQAIETRKQREVDEQIQIMMYLLGILAIVVLAGTLTNKWIFFDSEQDFFMTLGLLASITTCFFMIEEYDYKQNVTL